MLGFNQMHVERLLHFVLHFIEKYGHLNVSMLIDRSVMPSLPSLLLAAFLSTTAVTVLFIAESIEGARGGRTLPKGFICSQGLSLGPYDSQTVAVQLTNH